MPHYVLGLHPPVQLAIGVVFGNKTLVNHAAVRVKSFVGGACDVHDYRLYLLQQGLVAKHKRGLVDEP